MLPTYQAKEAGETFASILQAFGSATAGTIGAYVALWGLWKTYPTVWDESKEWWGRIVAPFTEKGWFKETFPTWYDEDGSIKWFWE